MKRFAIRLLIFAVIAVTLDLCVGAVFSKICEMNRGGDVYRLINIMDKMDDEIIIMGSSRAVHHYDPFIIEDSLGMSCQNCGFDGNGIIMHYALWKGISKRYYPKVLIYDLLPVFDLGTGFNNHRYLSRLKPFYRSNPEIDQVFWDVDIKERYKMLAQTYQYNSNCTDILAGWIHPLWEDEGKGYLPLSGEMPPTSVVNKSIASKEKDYDPLKLDYFQRLINDCKGKTKLIVMVSPEYNGFGDENFNQIKIMCKSNDVLFLDYSSYFKGRTDLFKDAYHLNRKGATFFTKMICRKIAGN